MMTFFLQVVCIMANGTLDNRIFHVSDCDSIGEAITAVGDAIQADEIFVGAKDIIISTEITKI